jgi:hypothetical protein
MIMNDMFDDLPLADGTGGLIVGRKLELTLDEVVVKLGGTGSRQGLVDATSAILDTAKSLWRPKALYRWVDVTITKDDTTQLFCNHSKQKIDLELGYSTRFIKESKQALIGVYTVGTELEDAAGKATGGGRVLDGYLYDIIGLVVLDKMRQSISSVAEHRCRELGWGVSPFLSPGSVHGWDLEEQTTLCSILPLNTIEVAIQESGVLLPFKSISFVIGIGPGYQATKVGDTCEVCSKKDSCEMRNSR